MLGLRDDLIFYTVNVSLDLNVFGRAAIFIFLHLLTIFLDNCCDDWTDWYLTLEPWMVTNLFKRDSILWVWL